jgi:hypothetical protein
MQEYMLTFEQQWTDQASGRSLPKFVTDELPRYLTDPAPLDRTHQERGHR